MEGGGGEGVNDSRIQPDTSDHIEVSSISLPKMWSHFLIGLNSQLEFRMPALFY